MANLPQDLITKIISLLPVKPLLRFKCVSKAWCSTITSNNFIKTHLQEAIKNNNISLIFTLDDILHSVSYDPHNARSTDLNHPSISEHVTIHGSCNGLVHIKFYDDRWEFKRNALWNPCTEEFRVLPKSPMNKEFEDEYKRVNDFLMVCHMCGIGYSSVMDDCRLVEVYQFFNRSFQFIGSKVIIYSLGTNSWKMIDGAPYFISHAAQLLTNENPHWPVLSCPGGVLSKSVRYFDLVKENFCEIQYPECVEDVVNVEMLGGCLCIVGGLEEARSDVWVMKEYGVVESWTKLFRINCSIVLPSVKELKVLFSDENGKVLLDDMHGSLVLYDPKCETAEAIEIQGLPRDWYKMHLYVGSLVSLKSGRYVNRERCRAKNRQTKKRKTWK